MFCNHPKHCRDEEAHEKLDKLVERLGTFYCPISKGGLYKAGVSAKRIEFLEARLMLLMEYLKLDFIDEPSRTIIRKRSK